MRKLSQNSDVLKNIFAKLKQNPEFFDLQKAWVILTEDSGDNRYEHIKKFTNILNKYDIKIDWVSNNYIIVSTFEDLYENYRIEISKKAIYFKMKSTKYIDEMVKIFEKMIDYKKSNPIV